jgi:long-subunit fatty acid transport protein
MYIKNSTAAIMALTVLFLPIKVHATKTITSPYVHKGERAVEWKGGYAVDDDSNDNWKMEAAASYGVTDYWETEFGVAGGDEGDDEDAEFRALIWENKFQLARPGIFWVDPGVKIKYERKLQGDPDEIQAKLLFAKQIGKFSNTANMSIEREVGEDSEDDFGYGFAYGLAYEHSEDLAYGLEWYSDFGNFEDDFDDQGHQVGPVAYGDALGLFEYEAGVLLGLSDAAPDALIKLVAEFEF